MRLRAGLGGLLLACLGGCAALALPQKVRIEVDDRFIEYHGKKAVAEAPADVRAR